MATEKFENNASTTLNDTGGIDGSVTTFVVTSSSGFPTTGNFRIKVESELMLVTNVSGTTWTVTRGIEGSSAASHADGVDITHIVTSGTMEQFAQKPTSAPTVGEFATYADTTGDQLALASTYGVSAGAILNVADITQPVIIAPSINVGGGNTVSTSINSAAIGTANTIAANHSLVIGDSNEISADGDYSLASGNLNQIDSTYSFAVGQSNTINANQLTCLALGGYARCYDWGQMSFGGYVNHTATTGNLAQRCWYTSRTRTATTSQTELFLDWTNGSSSNSKRITLPPNSCMTGDIQVLGMLADYSTFGTIHIRFLATNTGSSALIQNQTTIYSSAFGSTFDLGTGTDTLNLFVTPVDSGDRIWLASVQLTVMRVGGGYYSS